MNTVSAQHFLFFFLWLEQILYGNVFLSIIIIGSFSMLYAIAFDDYPLLGVFLSIFLISIQ